MISTDDITLEQTCGACPEQYDAYFNGERVGYLRLRHGYFAVKYLNPSGELLYDANPDGDGCFEVEERDMYLTAAKNAIIRKLIDVAVNSI